MLHALSIWVLVVGFLGAGLFNAIGTPATQNDFVRWGYPPWWCRSTGGLELGCAILIALSGSREVGLILGIIIIVDGVSERQFGNRCFATSTTTSGWFRPHFASFMAASGRK